MARITVVGSGVVGMSIAAILARHHQVTIVARNLPGDDLSIEWASPWAGASFIAGSCASQAERRMQLDSFAQLWRWSFEAPECGLKRITVEDYHDDKSSDDIWWKHYMPEFTFLPSISAPEGAKLGTSYKTVVFRPDVFLPWLKQRLVAMGVGFQRRSLHALADVRHLGHDVLINATGIGSKDLIEVQDQSVQLVRGQTIVVKHSYSKLFMRDNGNTYTYAIPRLDGTVVLGGTRQTDSTDPNVDWEICQDIVNRLHRNLPSDFSSNLSDYEIIGHNVGIRPTRPSGIRVEKEEKDGQKIVHAYGVSGGGYIFGHGIALAVRDLVEDFLFSPTVSKL